MTMNTIKTTLEIAAPLSKLREAISTKEGFRAWWALDTEVDTERREATYTFAREKDPRSVTFKLDRVDDRGIAMTCVRQENNPDWLGTKLEISLEPTAKGTQVTLVHAGYPERNECYERCIEGWQYFMTSLDKYATTGTGTPYGKA
jgi:uncharacterized protein YndB with AHSA1/START domain